MKALWLAGLLFTTINVAASQPLDVLFVLDTSPGTEHAIDLIQASDLSEEDRAGVVRFGRTARVLQPLTEDHNKVADALQGVGIRTGVAIGAPANGEIYLHRTVDLAGALRTAGAEIGNHGLPDRKPIILVFLGGEDPKLNVQRDALSTLLRSTGAQVYAVVVPRVEQSAIYPAAQVGRQRFPTTPPVMTRQALSQLVKESGGRMFESGWSLKKILARARR